ncbi:MAG: hypothetical protein SGPRY_012359 [Prymnesium sp.]
MALEWVASLPLGLSAAQRLGPPSLSPAGPTKRLGPHSLELTFSDEFEYAEDDASWKDGPKWRASYGLNSDTYGETFLHPSMLSAANGTLRISASKQRLAGAPGGLAAGSMRIILAISACEPHAGYGLNSYQGRGAPEIDLLETTLCSHQMTEALSTTLGAKGNDTCLISSLQLAPRLPPSFRPLLFSPPDKEEGGGEMKGGGGQGGRVWYGDSIRYGPNSIGNHAFYGMYNYDTIGAVSVLNSSFYSEFHTIGLHSHVGPSCLAKSWPRPAGVEAQEVAALEARRMMWRARLRGREGGGQVEVRVARWERQGARRGQGGRGR